MVTQFFQKIDGTLAVDGKSVPIEEAKLTGEQLTFAARVNDVRYEFSGRVSNHAIEGSVKTAASAAPQAWIASQTEIWDPRHLALPAPTLVPPPVQ